MRLRSPSQRKPPNKASPDNRPAAARRPKQTQKSTKGFNSPTSPTESQHSGPLVAPGMKATERMRAILDCLREERTQKRKSVSGSSLEATSKHGEKKKSKSTAEEVSNQPPPPKAKNTTTDEVNARSPKTKSKRHAPPVTVIEEEPGTDEHVQPPPRKTKKPISICKPIRRGIITDLTLAEHDNPILKEQVPLPAPPVQAQNINLILRRSPRRQKNVSNVLPPTQNRPTSQQSSRQSNYPPAPPLRSANHLAKSATPLQDAQLPAEVRTCSQNHPSQIQPTNSLNAGGGDEEQNPPVDQDVLAVPLSIRCKSKNKAIEEGSSQATKKTRSVVNGAEVQARVRILKGKIKLEYAPEHGGPDDNDDRSLLVHEIGSCVREKVPMDADKFNEISAEAMRIVINHLTPNFEIDMDQDGWMWKFIKTKVNQMFRRWKADCKQHFIKYGIQVPEEFQDRQQEWNWLVNHFQMERNTILGEKMRAARLSKNKINHRSGKMPFSYRAAKHSRGGSKAPLIATYEEVYSKDPIGASKAAQMNEQVNDILHVDGESTDQCVIDERPPLDVTNQLNIIRNVVGQTRGNHVSGAGAYFKRPGLPRGGARTSSQSLLLEEELRKTREEFGERIRALEEALRVRSLSAAASDNRSDSATSNMA